MVPLSTASMLLRRFKATACVEALESSLWGSTKEHFLPLRLRNCLKIIEKNLFSKAFYTENQMLLIKVVSIIALCLMIQLTFCTSVPTIKHLIKFIKGKL